MLKALRFRALVWWYRALGSSAVQAEWKARQATQRAQRAVAVAGERQWRVDDARFNCVCGQLMVKGDARCPQCARRQYMPFWMRRLLRNFGLEKASVGTMGTTLAAVSMLIGYLAQMRHGGSFWSPTSSLSMLELGASIGPLTLGPQPWRAFTYTMLHGGLMHLVFNGMALVQVGPLVERTFGSARFLFGWVIGGAMGAFVPALIGSGGTLIGASGAIFGLIGMAMMYGHRVGTTHGRMVRDVMIKWTVIVTLFGVVIGGISHAAHFGGLGAGAVVGLLFPPVGRDPARRRLTLPLGFISIATPVAALLLFLTWFVAGARPPESADHGFVDAWYYLVEDQRGVEAALDEPGRRMAIEAKKKGELSPADPAWLAYMGDVEAALRTAPRGQRLVLVRALVKRLPDRKHGDLDALLRRLIAEGVLKPPR